MICETCAIFVFNVVHVGENLLAYVCGSKDRQDSKCILFHVFIFIGESIPCFENELVRFWVVFSFTPIVSLSKISLLTGYIFKVSCQTSKLRYSCVLVVNVGQFYFKIRLTQNKVDLPMQSYLVQMDRC